MNLRHYKETFVNLCAKNLINVVDIINMESSACFILAVGPRPHPLPLRGPPSPSLTVRSSSPELNQLESASCYAGQLLAHVFDPDLSPKWKMLKAWKIFKKE